MTVLLLELNEINFRQVEAYAAAGELPTLGALIRDHGIAETTSERDYEELEPWIQWVTAHTGKSLAEHGVFRLGDIVDTEIDQIWEVLERQDIKVGAISPMNAKNRCHHAAFFMPDPWTVTPVTGNPALQQLYTPIAQAVNDNATAKLTPGSLLQLIRGMAHYVRPSSISGFAGDVLGVARGRSWRKALVLDRLLADVFIRETARTKPQFASLFLNAGAHIQHHYLFNSKTYDGKLRNPAWYVPADQDPVLDVYRLYDAVVRNIKRAFPGARLMLATAIHQNPHGASTMYWRLRDHAAFLQSVGVAFVRVEPRMSRDFVVICGNEAAAGIAADRLAMIRTAGGVPLFDVDNRGDDLFVTLNWAEDITTDTEWLVANEKRTNLRAEVAFVAVKNGEHDGIGYFIDTGADLERKRFPLSDLPAIIAEACGVTWPTRNNAVCADASSPAVGAR